jgi:hypothetical protein
MHVDLSQSLEPLDALNRLALNFRGHFGRERLSCSAVPLVASSRWSAELGLGRRE